MPDTEYQPQDKFLIINAYTPKQISSDVLILFSESVVIRQKYEFTSVLWWCMTKAIKSWAFISSNDYVTQGRADLSA